MDKTMPKAPQHPADQYSARYLNTITQSAKQIDLAYKAGFDAGTVHIIMAQAQQLSKVANDSEVKADLIPGLKAAAEYLATIGQGGSYAFEKGLKQEDGIKKHQDRDGGRQASEASRSHRTGTGKKIEAQA